MGLIYPSDLSAWRKWQSSQTKLRSLRHVGQSAPARVYLSTFGSPSPVLLVALDSTSPTSRAALVEAVARFNAPFAVVSPTKRSVVVPGIRPSATTELRTLELPQALRSVKAAVGLGHYMSHGWLAYRWSQQLAVPFYVVQHGALTPFTPPLPEGARLLSWSEADASFWMSDRADVDHEVVGSQLLWTAGNRPINAAGSKPLTYLGQGHAAELSRTKLAWAALRFTREHSAVYRPHPSERDKLSRLTHAAYVRVGIEMSDATALNELTGSVVSVFSTGVIEAAAQGRDAWVQFPRPPDWLREFWDRYDMRQFGEHPTPAPRRPSVEPAQKVASILRSAVA